MNEDLGQRSEPIDTTNNNQPKKVTSTNESSKTSWLIFGLIAIVVTIVLIVLSKSSDNDTSQPTTAGASTIKDSIETARKDSTNRFYVVEQDKVIGDIRFGILKKEFDVLVRKFDAKNVSKEELDFSHYIGEFKYRSVEGITGQFYDKKLYQVDIGGRFISYEHYDSELRDQAAILYKIIYTKYGPSSYGSGVVEMHKTEYGYSYLANGWSVGTKKIQIRVQSHGTHYSVDLTIYQPAIVNMLKKAEEQKSDSATKKAANAL